MPATPHLIHNITKGRHLPTWYDVRKSEHRSINLDLGRKQRMNFQTSSRPLSNHSPPAGLLATTLPMSGGARAFTPEQAYQPR